MHDDQAVELRGDFDQRGGPCDPHDTSGYTSPFREFLFSGDDRAVSQASIRFFPSFPAPTKLGSRLRQVFGIYLMGYSIDVGKRANLDGAILFDIGKHNDRTTASLVEQFRLQLFSKTDDPHVLLVARIPAGPHLSDGRRTTLPSLLCFCDHCAQQACCEGK
ncbi:hypothetical protein thsrh120_59070 [Rhizobium sp. No.120]